VQWGAWFYPLGPSDKNMFAAYGGADLTINGEFLRAGSAATGKNVTIKFDDFYTFAPTGFLGLRTAFPSYDAARYLELNCCTEPFKHSLTYTDTITFNFYDRPSLIPID